MVNILKKLRDQLVEGAFSDTACALKSLLLFRAFASFMAGSVVYFTDPADEEGSTKLAGEFSSYMWYEYFSYIRDDYEMYDHVFEYHYLFCIERNFILAKYLADINFFNPWLSPYASAKAFFEYVMKYIFGHPGEDK